MTDVEDRLTRAGTDWRAAQPAPRPVDPTLFGPPPRRWRPVAAAAAVTLVVAGAVGVTAGLRRDEPAPAAAPASAPAGPWADRVVRDGDRVAVSGEVRAVPGRPVRMCVPLPTVAAAGPAGAPRQPPAYCDLGVTLQGADLAALAGRRVDRGVVVGDARVDGTYRAGTLTVERQAGPDPRDPRDGETSPPPCRPPAGGWTPGEAGSGRLVAYVRAHPDRYLDPWVAYPGKTSPPTTVDVVGTTLDPAVAERELRALRAGNVCVVPARHAWATLTATMDRITRSGELLLRQHGVFGHGPSPVTGTVGVRLVILDAAAQRWLAGLDGGAGVIDPYPWVRPLRR